MSIAVGDRRLAARPLCREIARRYEQGESSEALGREYGCSRVTILNRLPIGGGQSRPRKRSPLPHVGTPESDALDRRLTEHYAAGKTSSALAAELGCSPHAILDRLRRAGGQPRPRGAPPKQRAETEASGAMASCI